MRWLDQGQGEAIVKILHIGNIANNAYNNAKFQRRVGIQADVLCYDYSHVMAQPEWEDAEFQEEVDEYYPEWAQVNLNGFQRPDWFRYLDFNQLNANHFNGRKPLFRGQFALEWKWMRCCEAVRTAAQFVRWQWAYSRLVHHRHDQLQYDDVASQCVQIRYLAPFLKGYDLIQAYGLYEPKFALLITPNRPFVAFEHGTMRDLPFEEGRNGRWISLAYKKARKIIVTNPDSILSARRMGLENIEFIPHPVDETKFRPQATPLPTRLRNAQGREFVLFCPSRQNWALKGSDKVIRALADVVNRQKLDVALLLCRWGQEVERSQQLIEELGIGRNVVWLPPLNKMRLIEFYNAADVVLDQFTLGVFGTTTPEAMACGKPVVLYLNEDVHKWCFPVMPPVISACTPQEISFRIVELLRSPDQRMKIGRQARAWVERYHGWKLVVEKHIRLYHEILGS